MKERDWRNERTVDTLFVAVGLGLIALLVMAGCGTGGGGQLSLFPGRPKGVDQAVVEAYVCRGALPDAERYVTLRGESLADALERIERARTVVKGRSGCCVQGTCADEPRRDDQ